MTEQSFADRSRHNARVLLGSAIILIGLALLVERNDWWGLHIDVSWWPMVLLFVGFARIVVPGERDGRPASRRSGLWLLSIGIWGLVIETPFFGLDYSTAWPLLVIVLGINIAWDALEARPIRRIQEK